MSRQTIARLRTYLRDNIAWLLGPDVFWGNLGILVFSLLIVAHGPGTPEARVRWVGVLWQLLGIGFVLRGLIGKHTLFKVPHPIEELKAYFAKRPTWRRSAVVDLVGDSMKMDGGIVVGGVLPPTVDDTRPLLERVQRLEQWRLVATERFNNLHDAVERNSRDWKRELDVLRSSFNETNEKTREKLQEAVVGDPTNEWVGLWWIILGTIMSGVSDEFARMLCDLIRAWGCP